MGISLLIPSLSLLLVKNILREKVGSKTVIATNYILQILTNWPWADQPGWPALARGWPEEGGRIGEATHVANWSEEGQKGRVGIP